MGLSQWLIAPGRGPAWYAIANKPYNQLTEPTERAPFHHCLQRCFRRQKRWIMCILYYCIHIYIYNMYIIIHNINIYSIYIYTSVLYKLYEDPWPICNQRNRVSRIRLFFSIITHGRFETQALKYAEDERKPSTNKWRNQFVNYKERKEENICRQIRNKENIQIEKHVSK